MKKGLLKFNNKPTEAEVERFLPQLPLSLPKNYIDFLKTYNGANDDLPVQPWNFELWELQNLSEFNNDY